MKNYYRVMLGEKSIYAEEAYKGNFVGVDFGIDRDLTNHLPDNWRDFNKEFIPLYLKNRPNKSKIAAGLACGMLWTLAKGLQIGDVVLCPDGKGNYNVGELTSGYEYKKGFVLPHRRNVRWYSSVIARSEMSDSLVNSTGAIGTLSRITKHSQELEDLISGRHPRIIVSTDETVEDPSVFALEEHLEDFLVKNWKSTELGKRYNIFEEEGELVGQQYESDTGPIDILAVSKDNKELLVVELKKGRASDVVVGQIQRYMGYVKDELAEPGQTVRGVIIAFEDDIRIQRVLSIVDNIDFFTYKIHFKLERKSKKQN
jgi:restriction system protein